MPLQAFCWGLVRIRFDGQYVLVKQRGGFLLPGAVLEVSGSGRLALMKIGVKFDPSRVHDLCLTAENDFQLSNVLDWFKTGEGRQKTLSCSVLGILHADELNEARFDTRRFLTHSTSGDAGTREVHFAEVFGLTLTGETYKRLAELASDPESNIELVLPGAIRNREKTPHGHAIHSLVAAFT